MKKIKANSIIVNPTDVQQGTTQDGIEDRSIYLRSDDNIVWDGASLTFISDIVLETINSSDGVIKQFTIAAAQSPVALNNNESAYISIDRTTSAAATIVVSDTVAIPVHSNSDKDIFVLFRRKDTAASKKILHIPIHKQAIEQGQSVRLGASGAGGGSGSKNYITNPQAETDASDWTIYKNTVVGDAPDDFGGTTSGNLTFTRNTTTPLSGDGDFQFSKAAFDVQGEGVYTSITVDKADLARKLIGSLDLDATHANLVDGDARYYMVSSNDSFVADFNVIRVNGEDLAASIVNYFQFQTESDDTEYRFCIHIATVNALAYDIFMDNFVIGPQIISHGTIVTGWEDFTTVVTNLGTSATTLTAKFKRIGDSAHIRIHMLKDGTAGTGTGTNLTFSFDEVGVADYTKMPIGTDNTDAQGFAAFNNGGTNGEALARIFTATTTTVSIQDVGSNQGLRGADIAANSTLQLDFIIPIEGWSSTAKMTADFSGREVLAEGKGNGGTVITASVTNIDFTETRDTTASFDGTVFTSPETGEYDIDGIMRYTSAVAGTMYAYIDTGSGYVLNKALGNLITAAVMLKFSGMLELKKGDKLAFRRDVGGTLINNISSHHIEIAKRSNPQTQFENELVYFKATDGSGQTVNTSQSTMTWDNVIKDTHGAFSAGVYTIPVTGEYDIKAKYFSGSVAWSVGHTLQIVIHKNGTTDESTEFVRLQAAITDAFQVSINDTLPLVKGDTIEIQAVVDVSSTINTGDKYNIFSIHRIK